MRRPQVFFSPSNPLDHRTPLQFSTDPGNVRSYGYPFKQREVVEKLVQDILDQGTIHERNSPFVSLVVLVGKKGSLLEAVCGLWNWGAE